MSSRAWGSLPPSAHPPIPPSVRPSVRPSPIPSPLTVPHPFPPLIFTHAHTCASIFSSTWAREMPIVRAARCCARPLSKSSASRRTSACSVRSLTSSSWTRRSCNEAPCKTGGSHVATQLIGSGAQRGVSAHLGTIRCAPARLGASQGISGHLQGVSGHRGVSSRDISGHLGASSRGISKHLGAPGVE